MADIKERIIIESVDKSKKGYSSAQKNASQLNKTLNTLKTTMAGLAGFFGLNILSGWIGRISKASDTVVEMEAKIKLVTESTEEYAYAQQELINISLESGSSLEANGILFTRLNKAIKKLGGDTQTTLDITKLMSNGLKISGASAQESASVIRQYSQAMNSGVLRGEEFNAIMENGGRIAQALADGLGVDIGQLREMAKQGQLTANIVNDALLSQSRTIQEEANKIPLTIGRAIENLSTKASMFLAQFNEANHTVASGLNVIAEHFIDIASAIGVVIKVATVLYGAHLIKSANAKIVQLKSERADRLAAAEAVKVQQQAEKDRAVTEAQTHARRTQFAAQEATLAVQRHKQAIQESNDAIARITLSEKELATQVRQLQWEIRSNTAKKGNALATKQLIGLKHRHLLSVEALRTANQSLIVSENKLTTAIELQNGAIRANSTAMTVSANATAVAAGRVATAAKVMTTASAMLGKASNFLLGIPGLLLYAAYEIADAFLIMEALIVSLKSGFNKLGAAAVLAWQILSNPGDISHHLDEYRVKLTQIDQETMAAFDKIIANEQQKQNSFKQTQKQRVTSNLDALQQISEAEKKYQKEQQAFIDTELEIKKIALGQQLEDKIAYEAAIKELENQSLEEKEQLTVDRLAKESELYANYYDEQISVLTENNEKIAEELRNTDAIKLAQARQYNSELITLYGEANEKIADQQQDNNDKILQLEQDKASHLKRISKETLNTLITNAHRLLEQERDARTRSKSVLKEYSDFVKRINGDQRTSYQKNADAQKALREIEAKLRQASKLELKGNHKEAKRISEEALSAVKDITLSQKEHASIAKKGSLAQIRANGNVKKALDLVKQATDSVKTSSDSLADSAKEDLNDRVKSINSYKELIKELDKQLNTKRTITAEVNMSAISAQLSEINNKIKALSQTITITTKHVNASNGAEVKRADGGFIPRKDKVPGSGSGDKVKALLEPGEFIMRKSAVQQYGEKAMYALNHGKEVIKRKVGGIVPGIQKFSGGGQVDGLSNDYLSQLMTKYEKLYKGYITRSQEPRKGNKGAFLAVNATQSASYIKKIMETIPKLRGKSPDVVSRVMGFNEDIARFVSSHVKGMKRGEGVELKKLITLRDIWLGFKFGGMVRKFEKGGQVDGSGIGDTIKALLTPGEFVVNKSAVQQFGADFFDNVNAGVMPQRFTNGGMVRNESNNVSDTINVNLNINGKEAVGSFQKNDATMELINQLKSAEAST